MAKELPYFKFFCSEWNDGDITLEDFKIQGLFINICSYYWSNECDLTFKTLKKKFKYNTEDIDYLLSERLIKESNGNVSISFLDEQLQERIDTSKKNSLAGKASAEARRLKKLQEENKESSTEIQQPLNFGSTETQPLREDKKREDKKRVKDFTSKEYQDELVMFFNKKAKEEKLDNVKVLKEVKEAYDYYQDLDWKNSNNKKIANLKSTIWNNWIKRDLEKFRKEVSDGFPY